MKWTPEVIERLRELAGAGKTSKESAQILGASLGSLRFYAYREKISFARPPTYEKSPRLIQPRASDDTETRQLRGRWLAMIGAMKQQLRDDILRAEA